MAQEDIVLAQIEQGRIEAERTEAMRQERYKNEDAATARIRAAEDRLYAEGDAHRDAVKASLEATLAARANTPEKQAQDAIEALQARIAHLESLAPAEKPAA